MKTGKSAEKTGRHPSAGDKASRVVIITGLSGSGKTVALRAVEDAGFFCVDNLPVSLISSLIDNISLNRKLKNIALGVDIREKEFLADTEKVLNALRSKHRLEILFLEAETEVLIRRFKETRRPHPLGGKLEEAIKQEKESLAMLRSNADRVIDTSSFSPHQLRKLIPSIYFPRSGRKDLTIGLVSFGFKYGVPLNTDLLFDVRFLPNPHFIPSLRPLNGKNRRIVNYVFKHAETIEFMTKIEDLLNFLIPLYIKEGKSYLSIAVGCTGGNHRSPAIIERIAKLIKKGNITLNIVHRDMS
ncbi:MAG: RNase adapter RapZ [Nitrospirota bacterium]|nr:RNase adapter RapZ [Nitrospirota bacterium]